MVYIPQVQAVVFLVLEVGVLLLVLEASASLRYSYLQSLLRYTHLESQERRRAATLLSREYASLKKKERGITNQRNSCNRIIPSYLAPAASAVDVRSRSKRNKNTGSGTSTLWMHRETDVHAFCRKNKEVMAPYANTASHIRPSPTYAQGTYFLDQRCIHRIRLVLLRCLSPRHAVAELLPARQTRTEVKKMLQRFFTRAQGGKVCFQKKAPFHKISRQSLYTYLAHPEDNTMFTSQRKVLWIGHQIAA